MNRRQAERNIALAEALESGKYKQIENFLHNGEGFCCLGVACDLINSGGWKCPEFLGDSGYRFDGATQTAPESITVLYGWRDDNPTLPGFDNAPDFGAAGLNDSGATFREIARGFRLLAALEYEGEKP